MKTNINIPLSNLPIGTNGKVIALTAKGSVRRRMLDLGFVQNTHVLAVRKSPAGDPIAYKVRGAIVALRKEEASNVLIEQFV